MRGWMCLGGWRLGLGGDSGGSGWDCCESREALRFNAMHGELIWPTSLWAFSFSSPSFLFMFHLSTLVVSTGHRRELAHAQAVCEACSLLCSILRG